MGLEIVSGKAGYVSQSSVTTAIPVGSTPAVMSGQVVQFRIGNGVVMFRSPLFVSITAGDEVAAIGRLKNGVFHAVALRNLTTGAEYCPPTGVYTALGWGMVIVGVPALGLAGSGVLLIGAGILMLMRGGSIKGAYRKLKKATTT
jgi:hypothetical protein